MNKNQLRFLAASALTVCSLQVLADEPASPLSFNVGVATEYRYRGLAQSSFKPALQGGADYASPSGYYIGAWGSTIDWIKDDGKTAGANTGSTNVEIDLYGGYKGTAANGMGFDFGLLQYYYPGNKYSAITGAANANTTEAYGALTVGVVTVKYSHSLTNLFGFGNSKGSGYLDMTATFDLGNGWSLAPHVGRQNIKGTNSIYSYSDVSITVGKDLGKGLSASLMGVVTSNQNNWLTSTDHNQKSKGKAAAVAGLKYTF